MDVPDTATRPDDCLGSGPVLIIGYGGTGAAAAAAVGEQAASSEVIVVERRSDRARSAESTGWSVVVGDATEAAVLRRAGVARARCVVVTCMDDATTAMVVTLVRRLASPARVVAAMRQPQHVPALRQAGADLVMATERMGANLAAKTVAGLDTAGATRVMLAEGVRGRRPTSEEIGIPVRQCHPVVLAVLREGIRYWRDDPAVSHVSEGDVLIGWAP
ncbi:NAD-binding protein [Actinosynnema sp. NPDC059335]|uniref:NAD-binding protein n=1 Tax=Actinosynnema sp. NPDC059335 TaxID=3346804 RepID=UPI00366AA8EE